MIRLRDLRSTWKRKPWKLNTWPASGIVRASWMTRPGDRRRLLVGQMPVHGAVEVADRHRAVDVDRAVGLRAHALRREIVLVRDVADDLLKNVFQRDEALHLAVLVDDEREVGLAWPGKP